VGKELVISEKHNVAAIFENGKIVEFFINEGEQLVGDIVLGKVESIVQSIDGAFVCIGKNRNGFIHVSDLVPPDKQKKSGIKSHLKQKQPLLVQIAKESTGSKGPRLTAMLTIPGRYIVLTPYERKIGISKKITDPNERERLMNIAKSICQSGYGLIMRTEATDQTEESIKEDLDYLLKRWQEILKMSETASMPATLYKDQDLLYRLLRDALSSDVNKIIIDTAEGKKRAIDILESWSSESSKLVVLTKENKNLAVEFGIFDELEKAIQPRVALSSGGYLIIEQTEALTVIDVNSGSTRGTNNLNETILQTNKEAALEIARQIRLRDIGGVIVIDFIDMIDPREQQIVWQLLAQATKNDKSQPQIGYFSEFSLLEITRHRQKKSLTEKLTIKCPYCNGLGRLRNHVYRTDLLNQDSINIRLDVDETKVEKIPEPELKENVEEVKENLKENVEYIDKRAKLPIEVQKYKKEFQTNQIAYPIEEQKYKKDLPTNQIAYPRYDKASKQQNNNGYKNDYKNGNSHNGNGNGGYYEYKFDKELEKYIDKVEDYSEDDFIEIEEIKAPIVKNFKTNRDSDIITLKTDVLEIEDIIEESTDLVKDEEILEISEPQENLPEEKIEKDFSEEDDKAYRDRKSKYQRFKEKAKKYKERKFESRQEKIEDESSIIEISEPQVQEEIVEKIEEPINVIKVKEPQEPSKVTYKEEVIENFVKPKKPRRIMSFKPRVKKTSTKLL